MTITDTIPSVSNVNGIEINTNSTSAQRLITLYRKSSDGIRLARCELLTGLLTASV